MFKITRRFLYHIDYMVNCIEFYLMTSLDSRCKLNASYAVIDSFRGPVRGPDRPVILVCGPLALEGQSSTVYELTE